MGEVKNFIFRFQFLYGKQPDTNACTYIVYFCNFYSVNFLNCWFHTVDKYVQRLSTDKANIDQISIIGKSLKFESYLSFENEYEHTKQNLQEKDDSKGNRKLENQ